MRWLEERGIAYEKIDVTAKGAAFAEMAKLSGQTRSPVIEVEGKVLADFGPDELAEFWKQFEKS